MMRWPATGRFATLSTDDVPAHRRARTAGVVEAPVHVPGPVDHGRGGRTAGVYHAGIHRCAATDRRSVPVFGAVDGRVSSTVYFGHSYGRRRHEPGESEADTLGLLFLTDLGGVDIVAGKLLVTGLNALLALTAVLPVLGVAMILGGITGGESRHPHSHCSTR